MTSLMPNSSAAAAAASSGLPATVPASQHPLGPSYKDMFKPREVQAVMAEVLQAQLRGKVYSQNDTGQWAKDISCEIKNRLKQMGHARYKHMVQVVIGENKGAGGRVGARCLWDAQTDRIAQETFQSDSIFAVAVAFGVYLY